MTTTSRPSSDLRGLLPPNARRVTAAIAVLALLPYAVLKVLWLAGSRIGMVPGAGPSHMHDARMEIGNVVTLVLAAIGVVVVLALSQRWGLRTPWWLIVLPAAVATGALAPIALGLPVGVVLQAVIAGDVSSGGEGDLLPAVFAVVYGGFALYGIALAVLFADYAHRRWGALLSAPPRAPRPAARIAAVTALGAFAAAAVFWALAPAGAGLAGWESLAQRTVLIVVALLTLLGGAALATASPALPRTRWAAGWIGCSTAAVQGPTLLLLANDAAIDPLLLAATILATPAAAWLGLSALRRGAAG